MSLALKNLCKLRDDAHGLVFLINPHRLSHFCVHQKTIAANLFCAHLIFRPGKGHGSVLLLLLLFLLLRVAAVRRRHPCLKVFALRRAHEESGVHGLTHSSMDKRRCCSTLETLAHQIADSKRAAIDILRSLSYWLILRFSACRLLMNTLPEMFLS